MSILEFVLCAVIGYLLGCISTGILISSRYGTDIRSLGSHSTGATNVMRVMGPRFGLLTFAGDFFKASLAVLLGRFAAGQSGALAAGLFVVLGHNWPVFYCFKGGKGIVCSVAVLLWICLPGALISAAVTIAIIAISKYVSLGSLAFLLVSAIYINVSFAFWPMGIWSILLLLLGLYQHRANIKRLLVGKENKLSFRH